jgi:DNA-binding beta-propeller fold protein YncE
MAIQVRADKRLLENVSVPMEAGKREYEAVDGFFERPKKWPFVEVADVDVDSDDNVYVFTRSPRPVMIFDKTGKFIHAWGEMDEHYFRDPHGISIAPDGTVWTADEHDHTVRQWTKDGKPLMTLGRVDWPPPEPGAPFNQPTCADVASNGDVYVSDGANTPNPRIHCFDSSGTLKFSWGSKGSGPGQFQKLHSVFIDQSDNDKVYAADRMNNRVQYFSPKGEYLGEWKELLMANSVRKGPDGAFYVAELQGRISVLSASGELLARWGMNDAARKGERIRNEPGAGWLAGPHGIAVDSEGSVYLADVAESYCGLDRGNRSIQKFARV